MVELGCGVGLLGICLHRVGAGPLTLTDGDIRTVTNCCSNLNLNDIFTSVSVKPRRHGDSSALQQKKEDCEKVICSQLLWEKMSTEDAVAMQPDIIIGSDLLFDPGMCVVNIEVDIPTS